MAGASAGPVGGVMFGQVGPGGSGNRPPANLWGARLVRDANSTVKNDLATELGISERACPSNGAFSWPPEPAIDDKSGVPTGIRTPVLTVKGWCPGPG